MPRFHLRKWYLDCVSPDGKGIILYAARLRWSFLRLHYTARISFNAKDAGHSYHHSLKGFSEPQVTSGSITFSEPRLDISATFQRSSLALDEQLLETSEGSINWSCIAPDAMADIRYGSDRFVGHGYVELIELGLPPSRLGIEELRWGRFIGADANLVWIEWKGRNSRKFIYLNGQKVDATINEQGVILGEGTLHFLHPTTLRHDPIGRSLRIPFLRPVLRYLHIDLDERKYITKARWTDHHGSTDGWAIYEVVRWPK